jgi:hypothetical protein
MYGTSMMKYHEGGVSNMSDADKVTKSLSDLIIADTFIKHGVTNDKRRNLDPEQKQQIRELVDDLKRQVDQFVKGHTGEAAQAADVAPKSSTRPEPATPKAKAAPPTLLDSGPRTRPRMTLRKKK